MAKKKRSQRKRNFSYSSSSVRPAQAKPTSLSQEANQVSPATVVNSKPAVNDSKLDFLHQDLKKVAILAISCVVLEAVLWILLQHTTLGAKIFGL